MFSQSSQLCLKSKLMAVEKLCQAFLRWLKPREIQLTPLTFSLNCSVLYEFGDRVRSCIHLHADLERRIRLSWLQLHVSKCVLWGTGRVSFLHSLCRWTEKLACFITCLLHHFSKYLYLPYFNLSLLSCVRPCLDPFEPCQASLKFKRSHFVYISMQFREICWLPFAHQNLGLSSLSLCFSHMPGIQPQI